MSITDVKQHSIPVSDQQLAQEFYIEQLGFEVKTAALIDPDGRWLNVGPKRADSSVTLLNWPTLISKVRARHVILETDNIEKDVDRLKKQGINFIGQIESKEWGRQIMFKDPDNNRLVLQQNETI
jgi:lactoylglutathione lyase